MEKKKKPVKKSAPKKPSKKTAKPKNKKKPSEKKIETTTSSDADSYSFSAEFDPSISPDPFASSGASESMSFTTYIVTHPVQKENTVKGFNLLDRIGTTFRRFIDKLRTGCGRGGEEENIH